MSCVGSGPAWLPLLLRGLLAACLLQTSAARPYQLGYSLQKQQPMLPFKSCYDDILAVQQTVQSLTSSVAAVAMWSWYVSAQPRAAQVAQLTTVYAFR